MNCPAILTGDQFLSRVLGHIDCQAAFLGSYGWQALGQPGSIAANVMTGLLTLFVALFGIRLLFGPSPDGRDIVNDILKIGIVLTLAFSWPAFRTVIHDVVLEGPAELAATAGAPIMSQNSDLTQRIQEVDNLMLRLIERGTGRHIAAYVDAEKPGGTFQGQSLEDESSFSFARLFYITGLLSSYGLMRLMAGLLLALAPLAAGMLLFESTRGLFTGWMRALVLVLIGAAAVSVVTAGQIAILLPWLTDVLRLRTLGYAAPAAPTELLAMTLGFALVEVGAIWLMGKIAFTRGWITVPKPTRNMEAFSSSKSYLHRELAPSFAQSRSQRLVDHIESQLRHDEVYRGDRTGGRLQSRSVEGTSAVGTAITKGAVVEPLGSSWRRTSQRRSTAATRRDRGHERTS
ncbi:hypothetical protein BA950_07685 [Erythrobacter sp. SAORIC-644]|uniref:type IV secretion system protein n=1 Tax=Erythrobacter sp. SAORIC-644 TaxID=1869314 RepID=UPI000C9F06F9|nr:type IV secretion system protein [Erythrobacter sp. SAORIC-644]PNQ76349.1 hypothetical protein BA950_07685 [Erythrobacter sp. SAORIC-644]